MHSDEARLNSNVEIDWDKVEEVSDGLYRTRLPTVGDTGSEWDDLAWFRKQGLRITDFRLANVVFQSSRTSVRRFQTTYIRLDDPAAQVTLPPRGTSGGKRVCALELSPDEHINYVWTYFRGGSANAPENWGHRSLRRPVYNGDKVIEYIRLRTNLERIADNRQPCTRLPLFGHEFTCHTNSDFVVAGFWGRSGRSLTKLGVYLKPASPERDPNRFRRAARGLLLAHSKHEATVLKMGVERGCELGSLPRAVVLQVVERLKDEEAAEYSSRYRWRSPFRSLHTSNRHIIC